MRAINARTPLLVPTPDGSGQAVHPDVLFVPEGFLGFPYWMACTPYPFGQDQLENPIIRVSRDGVAWQRFPGTPDPLVPAPLESRWHHADTDLVLHAGRLHLFYISTKSECASTIFSVISSDDAISWSEPAVIYRADWGVSPAVVVTRDGRWRLWYVFLDTMDSTARSTLWCRNASSSTAFGEAMPCELSIPGHTLWHLDVVACEAGFEALVAAFPEGTNPSRCRLFHAASRDGFLFRLSSPAPLLRPSLFGWDNRMVYRSALHRRDDGSYRLWYSAASWGMRCGIGLLEGPLDALRPVPGVVSHGAWYGRCAEDLAGLAKYALSRVVPTNVYRKLAAWRRAWRSH